MKIQVTRGDIQFGKCGSCSECPVALAVNRSFPRNYIEVTGNILRIDGVPFLLPLHVKNFISNFDTGQFIDGDYAQFKNAFEPFEFELEGV